jgi:hypothetical protein
MPNNKNKQTIKMHHAHKPGGGWGRARLTGRRRTEHDELRQTYRHEWRGDGQETRTSGLQYIRY